MIYIVSLLMLIGISAICISIYIFIFKEKPAINDENNNIQNNDPTGDNTEPQINTDPNINSETDNLPPVNETNPEPSDSETQIPPEETVVLPDPQDNIDNVATLPRDKFNLPLPLTERPQAITAMIIGESEKKDDSYFTDSVFLGDSVTMGLRNYITKKRKTDEDFLSNAGFISVGSYGVYEAISDITEESIHSTYKGVKMQPQDILFEMGAKKVFISFGLNDVALFTIKEHINNYMLLIRRIQMKCPDIQIIILPTTPLTIEGEKANLYNNKIDEYNNEIIKFANENGCYFVDISKVLKDENGYLRDDLSSDNYCHLQDTAYDLWLDYLRTHTIPNPGEEKTDLEASVSNFELKEAPEVEGWEGPAGEA
jgi:lysophospholipase L1-like esterase